MLSNSESSRIESKWQPLTASECENRGCDRTFAVLVSVIGSGCGWLGWNWLNCWILIGASVRPAVIFEKESRLLLFKAIAKLEVGREIGRFATGLATFPLLYVTYTCFVISS